MRLAVVTTDFRPQFGGIATLFSVLARSCSEKCQVLVLATWVEGAQVFDSQQPYSVIRVPGFAVFREWAFISHLLRLHRTEGLDVVACASWFPAGLVAYLMWLFRKTPYLVWVHGSEIVDDWRTPRRIVKSFLRPLKKLILERSAGIVANSKYTETLVLNQGVSPQLIHVVTPAVDTNRFTPSPPTAAAQSRYRKGASHCLLTVARLDPHKGHALVLQALATSLRDIPGIRYLIAGSGPMESALRKLAASLGVDTQVDFLGNVPDDDLPDLYRAADIFVMPSGVLPGRLDFVEGFGIAYLEASACGTPIIGGRSGGSAEAVVDGVTGILINPDDPVAIGMAIRGLIQDPVLAQRLGQTGREWVATTLNPDRLAERFLTLAHDAILTQ